MVNVYTNVMVDSIADRRVEKLLSAGRRKDVPTDMDYMPVHFLPPLCVCGFPLLLLLREGGQDVIHSLSLITLFEDLVRLEQLHKSHAYIWIISVLLFDFWFKNKNEKDVRFVLTGSQTIKQTVVLSL